MPCSFCRDSYITFSRELHIGSIETTLRRNQFCQWLYALHNRVAAKLQKQALEVAGVPSRHINAVFEATKLSYEVLQKRLLITYPYFSEADVFTVLGILALSASEEACLKRKAHFVRFANSLAGLLSGFHLPRLKDLGASLLQALRRVTVENFDKEIMKRLLGVELQHRPSISESETHVRVLSLAKAGRCLAGACL